MGNAAKDDSRLVARVASDFARGGCKRLSYDIKALPLTYLIDRKGRVAARYQGVVDHDNLVTNIRDLLAERR